MLKTYASADGRLTPRYADDPNATVEVVWIDLVSPLEDESKRVGNALGMEIPSRAEMEEIELSSRLYQEDGAEFMTMIALANLDSDEVRKTPVTFILKGRTLVTVRYAESRPFAAFAARAQRPNALPIQDGEMVMLGLLEAMIDRIADALERTGNDIDAISTDVFHAKGNAQRRTRNLRSLIERIGQQGDLLTKFRESLVSMTRLTGYHTTLQDAGRGGGKERRSRIKVVQRDAASLSEHANFLSNKVNFLLDATLGLINLEQNQIIKIFSVAAVVLLPPTLVASNYGMNFDFMPELHWLFGYPFAVFLMFLSSLLPYLYFKRKGWL